MGYGNLFNGYQPIRTRQISLRSDNIAYPTTSHGIWRFIPQRGDYIRQNFALNVTL